MAVRHWAWPALRRVGSAAVLMSILVGSVGAQSPATDILRQWQTDNLKQWQSLSAQAQKAGDAGDYPKAIAATEKALALARKAFGDRDRHTLTTLNNLANLYQDQRRYSEAEPLLQEALQAKREIFGSRDPSTMIGLNNLATLYQAEARYGEAEPLLREALQISRDMPRDRRLVYVLHNLADVYYAQGDYSRAEPLYQEALQTSREVLGPRDPITLSSLNTLANNYQRQGLYGQAEPLYKEALQARRELLGPRDPETLTSLNNLAALYQGEGRYGEAEPLYQEALQAQLETLGLRHPDTLIGLNNLATLYIAQGRYGAAEPLLREGLQAMRDVLGPRNPDTLVSIDHLGDVYRLQDKYGEADSLYQEALKTSREVLGPHHPHTLTRLSNLGALYQAQGRYGEAEPLLQEALRAAREVLGPRHPNTLIGLNNLATLHIDQGRYGEAESLLHEALQASRETLGPHHPNTLGTQLNMVTLLVRQDKRAEGVRLLQQMEPNLLNWIGQELYSTESAADRRQLMLSQTTFQDAALTLATAENSSDAGRLAGSVILRFKLLQGEEEAYFARLTRRSQDPRVRALADEVGKLRTELAGAARGQPGAFEKALQALEAKQQALGEVSRDYKDHLRVLTANIEDLRSTLPMGATLIEFRQFRRADFRTGKMSEPRFAALLLTGSDEPLVADLGPVSELLQPTVEITDVAAAALYQKLFARFEDKLVGAATIYVAPDGILDLVPFARLRLADGRYWGERQEVRVLQTGRDLLRAEPDKTVRGLIALGGIDFGAAPTERDKPSNAAPAAAGSGVIGAITRAAQTFHDGFAQLRSSGNEAIQIKQLYEVVHKDETAEVWSGADASKEHLLAMKSPPRVLHLATHGFYIAGEAREPMLQSGVALAGANRSFTGNGADGILFALEAQGLNLDSTELVVLSACDTAQGTLDYSEGVYGLVRALRIAGARNVLVTLWPLNDGEARDFMVAFYKNWLGQVRSDPAKALHDTQLGYIKNDIPALRDPRVWAPYILVE